MILEARAEDNPSGDYSSEIYHLDVSTCRFLASRPDLWRGYLWDLVEGRQEHRSRSTDPNYLWEPCLPESDQQTGQLSNVCAGERPLLFHGGIPSPASERRSSVL